MYHRFHKLVPNLRRLRDTPGEWLIMVADKFHIYAKVNLTHRSLHSLSGCYHAFVRVFDQPSNKCQTALDHWATLAFALQADDTVILRFDQNIKTLPDVLDVDA